MATVTDRRRMPAELKIESVTAIVDTREQQPVTLAPLLSVTRTLNLADYSYIGGEHICRIERKSESDLLACVGRERERFDRECERLRAYETRAIVIESTWSELEAGQWRSQITPKQAVGSCLGWIASGVPIIMAGNHERAGQYIARLLFTSARRRWRESRALIAHLSATRIENHTCS